MLWWGLGSWTELSTPPPVSRAIIFLSKRKSNSVQLPPASSFRIQREHDLFLKGSQSSWAPSTCCGGFGLRHMIRPLPLEVCWGRSVVRRFILPLKEGYKQGPSILCLGYFCLPMLPWSARAVLGPGPQPEDVRTEGQEEAGFSVLHWNPLASELPVGPKRKYHSYLRHS